MEVCTAVRVIARLGGLLVVYCPIQNKLALSWFSCMVYFNLIARLDGLFFDLGIFLS
jgi:hypothetical protein